MSVDLASFAQTATVPAPATQSLFLGETVTGSRKLAQRFLGILMLKKGSIPMRAADGTDFITILERGAATELDVFAAFAVGAQQAMLQVKSLQLSTDPADEQLTGVRPTVIAVGSGSVFLGVTLTTADHSRIPLTIPLNFMLE